MAKNHNPAWSRDELILALHLYHSAGGLRRSEPEVIQLSSELHQLAHEHEGLDEYRSPNAVAMKLANFQALDPTSPVGMERGGAPTEAIWAEMGTDRARVAVLAAAVRAAAEKPLPPADGEDEATEGRLLWRQHRAHERRADMAARKKQQVLDQHGELRCEACDVAPEQRYGEAGRRALEVHHRLPLVEGVRSTRVADLALLCANCHRAIHGVEPLPSVEDFAASLSLASV
jgi:5-methylcytosine-specific restriction protein A